MTKLLFDEPYYIDINKARWAVAENSILELKNSGQLIVNNCLDVGCGPGWFAKRIHKMGIRVVGLEGRTELVQIARRRCPDAIFRHMDLENSHQLLEAPRSDLIFCFGILYHVENPFKLLRNLKLLTKKLLYIESIFVPSEYPCNWIVDEGQNETQGLSYHSVILSKTSLVAILHRIGFSCVYQYKGAVDHQDFNETEDMHARRAIFLAAYSKLKIAHFSECKPIGLPKFDFSKDIILRNKSERLYSDENC